jgi:hypothetical protein
MQRPNPAEQYVTRYTHECPERGPTSHNSRVEYDRRDEREPFRFPFRFLIGATDESGEANAED